MRATLALADVLVARHDSLRTHLGAARRGTVEGVHRARVATRRLREIVPVAATRLHGVRRRRLLRGLRALTRALGDVRECDVTLGLLRTLDTSSVAGLPQVVRKATQALRGRRREARISLGKASAAADVRKVDVRLQRLILVRRTAHDEAWRVLLARQLDVRARKLRVRLERTGVLYAIEPLHEVRIAGKRLRYALELVGDTRLAPVARLVRQLTQIQDVLGHLHDLDVLMAQLRETVTAAPDLMDGPAAVEHLDSALERERRSLHAAYLRRRASLVRLADSVRDDIVPKVRGELSDAPETTPGG